MVNKKNTPTPNDLGIGSAGDFTFPTDERLHQGLKDKLIFKGSTKSEQSIKKSIINY